MVLTVVIKGILIKNNAAILHQADRTGIPSKLLQSVLFQSHKYTNN
jgi:hypothetical protein